MYRCLLACTLLLAAGCSRRVAPVAERPWATRAGATITVHPSGASFAVPPAWVKSHEEQGNHFHLRHAELDRAERGHSEWQVTLAAVANDALPFRACAAHVGGGKWSPYGSGGLQVRLYELAEPAEAIERRVGAAFAGVRSDQDVPRGLERDAGGPWRRTAVSFFRWHFDYGAIGHVDCRVRRCGERTYVFAFLYTGREAQQETVEGILASFRPGPVP